MISAHIFRTARNFATSWKTLFVDRRLHVGDRVRERERDLLDRRAALLAHVVARDRDRVPLRDVLVAVGEDVGREPHRAFGRVDEVTPRGVFLEDVVLDRAAKDV
jgi:hypothetical protein